MIAERTLRDLYSNQRKSMQEIATELGCSANRVVYWMDKYQISRRGISEAIYQKHNPQGDPFKVKPVKTTKDAKLFGLGLGLYWGEGNKKNKYSVRLGNTDPGLLLAFMNFLIILFGVDRNDIKFGLQLFTDIDPEEALDYWTRKLDINSSQFYKITVTISGSLGTYRQKSQYGVVTIYYHNKKLRDILVGLLPT